MTTARQHKIMRGYARKAGLDDTGLHDVVRQVAGCERTRALTTDQADMVIQRLREMAGGAAGLPAGRRKAHGPVPDKIRALVWDLWHLGAWDQEPSETAIAAFVRRQAGVDDLRWLTPEKTSSVIEALRAMLVREGCRLPASVSPARALRIVHAAQWRKLEALRGLPAGALEPSHLGGATAPGADILALVKACGAMIRAERDAARDGGAP